MNRCFSPIGIDEIGKNQDKLINGTSVSSISTDSSIQSISIKSDLPIFTIDKSIPIFIDWLLQGFYRPETVCHQKIVLKIKSIVMRTTNNLFRKVHNYTHFKRWFTQFGRKWNIMEIFHYSQHFRRFWVRGGWGGVGWGGRIFEAGRLLTFLLLGWVLNRGGR